jgi:hypothetical protein
MESLLQGQAEQLVQKTVELALAGDITALRLCLERLIPPRKDRPINLSLPAIENVQHISLAMTRVSTAIGEGEITPMEGEVLSNVLAAHKAVLLTGDLERRVDELEQRMSQTTRGSATPSSTSGVQSGTPGAMSGTKTNLANRHTRLEQRLGPRPAPSPNAITLSLVFTTAELELLEERQLALERRDTSEDTGNAGFGPSISYGLGIRTYRQARSGRISRDGPKASS